MIKRELYMKRIRPFIGTELIKVMTGIRRCGKSVMLELIKEELAESGINPAQFISINFEDLNYAHLHAPQRSAARSISFSMRFRRSRIGKSASTPSASRWTATSISPARTRSFCPVSFPPISADATLSSSFIRSLSLSSWSYTVPLHRMIRFRNAFRSTFSPEECRTLPIFAMTMRRRSCISTTCLTPFSSRTS